jgi:menaquinone-dependent protoporphyrinogen IX oxidase
MRRRGVRQAGALHPRTEASGVSSKTLVAYVSAGGATEQYARVIADTLRSRGLEVDLTDLRRERVRDLSAYGTVVLGTGVRMAMVYRRSKRFLARKDLKGKRLAIYLSSGMAIDRPDEARERFLAPLVKRNGLDPVRFDAFPGKMPGSGGKLEDRTDDDIARRWAEELAGRLAAEA